MSSLPTHRNFRGHGGTYPFRSWPNGAALAVSLVVNVEEGAELAISMGDESNEFAYEAVERVDGGPDLCMESHFEYGPRAGWPRVRRVLRDFNLPATMNCNGRAIALSPWLAREAVSDGHEIAAHGWRWEPHAGMDEASERRVIADCSAVLSQASGVSVVGWHTRSATSVNTRRLLLEHGGFLYDSNAYNDDLPYVANEFDKSHIVLPYAFDTNDMRFYGGGFVQPDDFSRYCIGAFDELREESQAGVRMMSVGLHLRIIGRPGRIGGLKALLRHMTRSSDVWFARRDEIARAWRIMNDLPEWMPVR